MKIVYLHGMLSSPDSSKASALREAGHEVFAPALPKDSWDVSMMLAQRAIDEEDPDVVVASSRGGALALNINTGRLPLILIAPAWNKFGHQSPEVLERINSCHITLLHSPCDNVVSYEDSLVASAHLLNSVLIPVGSEHRMNDQLAIRAMLDAVFL